MNKKEQVEEQIFQKQKGVIFIKPFSKPVKNEKKNKIHRKERKFRNIIEVSRFNPRFFEEINSHSIKRDIWKAESFFRV